MGDIAEATRLGDRTTVHEDTVSGMFRFKNNVSLEELYTLAEEWKKSPQGHQYIDLHIRKFKDQWIIGVQYVREDEEEKSYHQYTHRMYNELKRRFGSNFITWELSQRTFKIT